MEAIFLAHQEQNLESGYRMLLKVKQLSVHYVATSLGTLRVAFMDYVLQVTTWFTPHDTTYRSYQE